MPNKKKNLKTTKVQSKVTKEQRKEIVQQEANKLEVLAQKAALKAFTEAQLEIQIELSDEQKNAAEQLSNGYSYDEVAASLGRTRQEVVSWMGLPVFARMVKELTVNGGSAEKDERVRIGKRIVSEAWNEILQRIENGELQNMTFATLEKFLLTWSQRLDSLVDKKGDEKNVSQGLAVLILQHVQSTNGRKYDNITEFLDDPNLKFPTIDVEHTSVG